MLDAALGIVGGAVLDVLRPEVLARLVALAVEEVVVVRADERP